MVLYVPKSILNLAHIIQITLNLKILQEVYEKFYSPSLGREIEMLVFGHWGYPVLLFPTSMGKYYQNRDFKLIESAQWFINKGKVKIYCIDSVDSDSWYAKHLHPSHRVHNHNLYDRMLYEELTPRLQRECGVDKVAVGGCSFGGYHAINFAFKHPDRVAHCYSMGGAFDIKQHLEGYSDEQVYFNCPPDFMPDAQSEHFYWMKIYLGTSEHDFCKTENEQMSTILHRKGIPHWLDIRPNAPHDWPVWREMFPHYLSLL